MIPCTKEAPDYRRGFPCGKAKPDSSLSLWRGSMPARHPLFSRTALIRTGDRDGLTPANSRWYRPGSGAGGYRRRGPTRGGFCHCGERGRAQSVRVALALRRHRNDAARGDFAQILRLTAARDGSNRAFIGRNQNRSGLGIEASVAAGELNHLSHGRIWTHLIYANHPATARSPSGANAATIKYAAAPKFRVGNYSAACSACSRSAVI